MQVSLAHFGQTCVDKKTSEIHCTDIFLIICEDKSLEDLPLKGNSHL